MRLGSLALTVTLFAVASLARPALAAGEPSAEEIVAKMMQRLDADKDGRISRAEAAGAKRMAAHFDRIDADHDGFVSLAELTVAVEKRLAKQKQGANF